MTASSKNRWLALVFVSIAVSLVIVDSTIVNVAIPSIVNDIGLTSTEVQWVQEAYTLVFAALLLVFGALSDKYGRRLLLVIGIGIFMLSSVFAATAATGGELIGWRVLQGVGGAIVLPTTLSVVNATFFGKERGIAFAVWGSTIGGMVAVGPLLGGWLTADYSWRWAFGINIPLGLIVIIGVLLFVTESNDAEHTRPIDWLGALLSVIASGTLVYGLIEGRTIGWWTPEVGANLFGAEWTYDISPVAISFGIFIVSVVLYIVHGLRRQRAGKSTLLAFSLFATPSFRNGNIVALIISMGEFGIILALPLWLQFVRGYTAFEAGLVILALAIGSFLASGLAGGLGSRVPAVWIVRSGTLLEIIGVAGIGFAISPTSDGSAVVPWLVVYGMGVGLATAQLTGIVLQDVPVDKSGQGSGTTSTSRQIGSALGIAVIGTMLFTTAQISFQNALDDKGIPADISKPIVSAVIDSAGGAIPALKANPKTADFATDAEAALSTGTANAAFTAASLLGVALIASFSLGRRPRKRD